MADSHGFSSGKGLLRRALLGALGFFGFSAASAQRPGRPGRPGRPRVRGVQTYSRVVNATNEVDRAKNGQLIENRDFTGQEPDDPRDNPKFGPAEEKRWVLYERLPDEPFDELTQQLQRQDTVTPPGTAPASDKHTVQYVAVDLDLEGERLNRAADRKDRLEPAMEAVADRLRPANVPNDPGEGVTFDELTPTERNQTIRYLLLCQGFRA